MVISRETKEFVVEKAKKELDGLQLLASINFKALSVRCHGFWQGNGKTTPASTLSLEINK